MKDWLKDLLLDITLGTAFLFLASIAAPVEIYNWLKDLFKTPEEEKKRQENTAMFYCPECGNDFEACLQKSRVYYDEENLAFITTYSPTKCPKCGHWATTPQKLAFIVCGPARMPRIEK